MTTRADPLDGTDGALIVILVSIKLRPLLRPTARRVSGASCGAAAAMLSGWLLGVPGERLGFPVWTLVPAAVVLATGIGWLLGPQAAKRDRWAAAGAAIAAAFLGVLLGAFVMAAMASTTWAGSVGEAILYTLGVGIFGFFFGVAPMVLAALPVAAIWVILVQVVTRALPRPPTEPAAARAAVGPRGRVPHKPFGRRRTAHAG